MKRIIMILSIGMMGLIVAAPVASAHIISNSQNTSTYIASDQTINDDLYVVGNAIEIDGNVNGDVYAAGQSITIAGTVHGDVFAVGQSVTVTGHVTGSVRAAGSSIHLGKTVIDGSTTTAGQVITIDKEAHIGGGLSVLGATADIRGAVKRGIIGAVSAVSIDGSVGKDVAMSVGTLTLGSHANISGNLAYRSKQTADLVRGSHVDGRTERLAPQAHNSTGAGRASALGILWSIASLFLVGVLLIRLAPTALAASAITVAGRPWKALGIGFAALLLTPVALLVIALTVIGLPVAILGLAAYIAAIYLATIPAALALSRVIYRGQVRVPNQYLLLIIGLIILSLLGVIPIIGGFVQLVTLILGLGGITHYLIHRQPHRKARPV